MEIYISDKLYFIMYRDVNLFQVKSICFILDSQTPLYTNNFFQCMEVNQSATCGEVTASNCGDEPKGLCFQIDGRGNAI